MNVKAKQFRFMSHIGYTIHQISFSSFSDWNTIYKIDVLVIRNVLEYHLGNIK